ncbi:MAG TPA: Cof-type HAD-IIB family hydrolase [Solirubrobacteraceae bacterium]|jgi:Cof subfamily protein (haloacid dehalogenase superfamily)|nr:Cof-type HAD-IIB family hydrolase [Solirubrobacteraceae bacterium]
MGATDEQQANAPAIRLVLSDVDGTLVTRAKELTPRAIEAVRRLREAGIMFALTSSRPPRGLAMFVEPLSLSTPLGAFNGGAMVDPDLSVIEERAIPGELVGAAIALLESSSLSVWVYRGEEWLVRDLHGPRVEHESHTVQFAPTLVESFEGMRDGVAKIVGVSDDHDAVARAREAAAERFGERLSATSSQPCYLDITHPDANKGSVVRYLAAHCDIPTEAIATIGDAGNDVAMFAAAGLSIAMGNAAPEVRAAARRVTTSNEEEGFAEAIERLLLGR